MSTDSSSDLHSQRPLRIITESDVVEAVVSGRGDLHVLERFAPHMMQGALTKEALFQLAFIIDDSDANTDTGLLYSAILMQAAQRVLGGDRAAWTTLRTRPGKFGEFLSALSAGENSVALEYAEMIRNTKPPRLAAELDSAPVDILDLVLTRLHLNYEALAYLRDHLQDKTVKGLVSSLLMLRGNDFAPGNA